MKLEISQLETSGLMFTNKKRAGEGREGREGKGEGESQGGKHAGDSIIKGGRGDDTVTSSLDVAGTRF